jgi:BirA family biotin operon repressor/biotin-[acetyl-CoA-carboxylase] ligase
MTYNFTNIFPDVRHYKLIDSTNTEAKRYLSSDYPTVPMWFVADEQNAGKGRMGSSWVSSNGNLFCSLVCSINWNLKLMPMLSALVAVSIHETLKFFLKESNEIKIKWPNDILIDNSKISGALIENIINGENKFSIIGIGININSSPKLEVYDTSHVNMYLEDNIKVNDVFLKLKHTLERKINKFSGKTSDLIRVAMLKNAWKINENINYISNSQEGNGIFKDVSENYEIILKNDSGQVKLNSGELKILRD